MSIMDLIDNSEIYWGPEIFDIDNEDRFEPFEVCVSPFSLIDSLADYRDENDSKVTKKGDNDNSESVDKESNISLGDITSAFEYQGKIINTDTEQTWNEGILPENNSTLDDDLNNLSKYDLPTNDNSLFDDIFNNVDNESLTDENLPNSGVANDTTFDSVGFDDFGANDFEFDVACE